MSVLSEYTVNWQHLVVLLYALEQMSGDIPTRAATVEYIESKGLLKYRPEDLRPYRTCTEPSWQTDVAFGRKDAVMAGYVHNLEWNSWDITRSGREFIQRVLRDGQDRKITASRCFLWSPRFKRIVVPDFQPSPADTPVPPKGERSVPSLETYERTVDHMLQKATIQQLAARMSLVLGISIPATRPSVAFALHTFMEKERQPNNG